MTVGEQVLELLLLLARDVIQRHAARPIAQRRLLTYLRQDLLLEIIGVGVAEEGRAALGLWCSISSGGVLVGRLRLV